MIYVKKKKKKNVNTKIIIKPLLKKTINNRHIYNISMVLLVIMGLLLVLLETLMDPDGL